MFLKCQLDFNVQKFLKFIIRFIFEVRETKNDMFTLRKDAQAGPPQISKTESFAIIVNDF